MSGPRKKDRSRVKALRKCLAAAAGTGATQAATKSTAAKSTVAVAAAAEAKKEDSRHEDLHRSDRSNESASELGQRIEGYKHQQYHHQNQPEPLSPNSLLGTGDTSEPLRRPSIPPPRFPIENRTLSGTISRASDVEPSPPYATGTEGELQNVLLSRGAEDRGGNGKGRGQQPSTLSHEAANGASSRKRVRVSVILALPPSAAPCPGPLPQSLDSPSYVLPLTVPALFPSSSTSFDGRRDVATRSPSPSVQRARSPPSFPARLSSARVSPSSTWCASDESDPGSHSSDVVAPASSSGRCSRGAGAEDTGQRMAVAWGPAWTGGPQHEGHVTSGGAAAAKEAEGAVFSPAGMELRGRAPSFSGFDGESGDSAAAGGTSLPCSWAAIAAMEASCVGERRGGEGGDALEASFKSLSPGDRQEEDRRLLGPKDRLLRLEEREQEQQPPRQWQLGLQQQEQQERRQEEEVEEKDEEQQQRHHHHQHQHQHHQQTHHQQKHQYHRSENTQRESLASKQQPSLESLLMAEDDGLGAAPNHGSHALSAEASLQSLTYIPPVTGMP